jgi:hypothetical protein
MQKTASDQLADRPLNCVRSGKVAGTLVEGSRQLRDREVVGVFVKDEGKDCRLDPCVFFGGGSRIA